MTEKWVWMWVGKQANTNRNFLEISARKFHSGQ